MHILIVGASGFIGQNLSKFLEKEGHSIIFCGRKNSPKRSEFSSKKWIDFESLSSEKLEAFDGVIHLSGASIIGKTWTPAYKKELLESRIETTKRLTHLIMACQSPPRIWLQASAIGIYPRVKGPYDEYSPPGPGFLSSLCEKWEAASDELEDSSHHIRMVYLRFGLALSTRGGALAKMIPDFKLGLGGSIGSGNQIISWIHIEDLCRMISWILSHDSLSGVFNVTSPGAVSQKTFAHALAKTLKRPCFFHLPAFLLRIFLGEAASIITEGSAILPSKALKYGFEFKFRDISKALEHLIKTAS